MREFFGVSNELWIEENSIWAFDENKLRMIHIETFFYINLVNNSFLKPHPKLYVTWQSSQNIDLGTNAF